MLKSFEKKEESIKNLADQCSSLEKQIESSVDEILKLIESINIDLQEASEVSEAKEVLNEKSTEQAAS